MNTGLIKYAFMAFAALIVVLTINPFVIIGAGGRGVVMNFGAVQKEILNEGLPVTIYAIFSYNLAKEWVVLLTILSTPILFTHAAQILSPIGNCGCRG